MPRSQRVFGVDFTSAPSRRKPITVAVGVTDGCHLHVHEVELCPSFATLAMQLAAEREWVAGFDFPFGQPRKYVEAVGWPGSWSAYVQHVAVNGKPAFVAQLREYQRGRSRGDIRHYREVDRISGACSPMQLDFVPVARMFYEGTVALQTASCSVYPFYCTDSDRRVAVEAYPALVARRVIQSLSYKTDNKKKQTEEQRTARIAIVGALKASQETTSTIRSAYGVAVLFSDQLAKDMIDDGTGDTLDAVLCAVQAGWAWSRCDADYGMNWECDPLEGWIADPVLLRSSTDSRPR